jgi:hypothetical protein
MYWMSGSTYEYHFADFDGNGVDMRDLVGDKWPNVRFLQLVYLAEEFQLAEPVDPLSSRLTDVPSSFSHDTQVLGDDRLSAIPEENPSEISDITDTALYSTFGTVAKENLEPLREAMIALMYDHVEPKNIDLQVDTQCKTFWLCDMNQVDCEGYPCIQLLLDDELIVNMYLGTVLPDDYQAVLNIYAATAKTQVIKRDTDLVTKEEEWTHWKELQEAMLEELKIWVKYKCFHMRPKKGVRNLMDSRNVNKWKWIQDANGQKKRIIRVRMALRGFKDHDADILET